MTKKNKLTFFKKMTLACDAAYEITLRFGKENPV
ncbi:hypothetical protein OKW24_001089 [Peribacillus simplex]|nr:hypothetical protein [Peribacillus simplex]